MKIANLIFVFFVLPGLAYAAPQSLLLSRGELINCKPVPNAQSLSKQADGVTVNCITSGNVLTFNTKQLVFPSGSKLVGKTKGGKVLWQSMTTPDGRSVSEIHDHPEYFTTLNSNADPLLHIVITQDLTIKR